MDTDQIDNNSTDRGQIDGDWIDSVQIDFDQTDHAKYVITREIMITELVVGQIRTRQILTTRWVMMGYSRYFLNGHVFRTYTDIDMCSNVSCRHMVLCSAFSTHQKMMLVTRHVDTIVIAIYVPHAHEHHMTMACIVLLYRLN